METTIEGLGLMAKSVAGLPWNEGTASGSIGVLQHTSCSPETIIPEGPSTQYYLGLWE